MAALHESVTGVEAEIAGLQALAGELGRAQQQLYDSLHESLERLASIDSEVVRAHTGMASMSDRVADLERRLSTTEKTLNEVLDLVSAKNSEARRARREETASE